MTDDERDLDQDLRELRVLDPARRARPGAGREPAAQALLEHILTSDSSAGSSDPLGGRPRWRRWAAAGAAVAAVAVGLVVLPPWGTPEQAFATWTAAPDVVPDSSMDELGAQCTSRSAQETLGQEVVMAEERGRVTFVVTASPSALGHCLLVDGEPHTSSSAGPRLPGQHPDVPPAGVDTYLAAGGGSGDEAYTAVVGRVGADVVAVEVHPSGLVDEAGALPPGDLPGSVDATVDNGYYGAWWPGITEGIELTIHLADGSVLPRVPAFDHEG